MAWKRMLGFGLGLAAIPGRAQAECLGSCLDGMVAALASIAVYAVIGIVLLVMLIRAKWRRAGLWALGCVAVLAMGVPLLSQGWLAWKLHRMERREIVGRPPDLTGRTPLLITDAGLCEYTACAAVLRGRAKAGVYVLPSEAVKDLDLTRPVPLAGLPLEFWVNVDSPDGETRRRLLAPGERQEALSRIDYLIVATFSYYQAESGPIEAGLAGNPALAGLDDNALVELFMAQLDAAGQVLDLAGLRPDLLDLSMSDRALALPLAPLNDRAAWNTPAGAEVAARALCPGPGGTADPNCLSLLDR